MQFVSSFRFHLHFPIKLKNAQNIANQLYITNMDIKSVCFRNFIPSVKIFKQNIMNSNEIIKLYRASQGKYNKGFLWNKYIL